MLLLKALWSNGLGEWFMTLVLLKDLCIGGCLAQISHDLKDRVIPYQCQYTESLFPVAPLDLGILK